MKAFVAMWLRDMMRLRREPSRWLGLVGQPLMFWAIIGSGIGQGFGTKSADGVGFQTYFFPGTLVMTVLFTALFASMSLIEDRREGILQAVVVSPAPLSWVVLGKAAGVTTLALLECLLFLLAAPLAGYSFSAMAFPTLFLALLLSSLFLAALNFVAAWLLDSTQGYHAVMSFLLLPLWIVSGAMFPLPSGTFWGWIGIFNPLAWSVTLVRAGLSGQDWTNPLWTPALCLIVATFVTLVLAVRVTAVARKHF